MIEEEPNLDTRRLNSPGPISDRFLLSRAFICVIVGPVGSAKTVTALRKLRRVGQMQKGRIDERGRIWRKARCGVIRENYPSIEKNTLPSWFRIHNESDGVFSWKAPYNHRLRLILGVDEDGQPNDILDLDMEFRAIGDKSVEQACRGWEVNAVLIDEADIQPSDLLAYLSGRVGRFSDLDPAMVVDPQIILSLNAPYITNWVYKLAVEKDLGDLNDPALLEALQGRPLLETFIQPGGRDPGAENLHNLPNGRGYYLIQAAVNKSKPGYVERMIDNKFVAQQHGQPVYADFRFAEHVATEPLKWNRNRMLIVGLDQGLFAAAVFMQRTPMGEIRVLDEVVVFKEEGSALQKIGPIAFGRMLKQKLADRFPGIKRDQIRLVCDPAAFQAEDNQAAEIDWVRIVRDQLKFPIRSAKTNSPPIRQEAVRKSQLERGGYLVDPRCKHLIAAHLGGYHFAKAEISDGETKGHLDVANTIHTHVADAEQYAALEGDHVIADLRGRDRVDRGQQSQSAYNPFANIGG
jgi:hypothetical protein